MASADVRVGELVGIEVVGLFGGLCSYVLLYCTYLRQGVCCTVLTLMNSVEDCM